MKRLIIIALFLVSLQYAEAQSLGSDTVFVPAAVRQYQFQLTEPASKLSKLRYELSGEPVKGNLSPDGKRVIMDNYRKGSRVKAVVIYADGREEEITKSPCFIDPVLYEL